MRDSRHAPRAGGFFLPGVGCRLVVMNPVANPATAAGLADALLALHVGVVVFVVGLRPLVLVGGARGWRWVRHRGLRLTHLGLMGFICAQALLGQLCPLTVWEQDLRRLAGQAATPRASSNTGSHGCCTGTCRGGRSWRRTPGSRGWWCGLGGGYAHKFKDRIKKVRR